MRKDWILISILSLVLVVGLSLYGFIKLSKKTITANPMPSSQQSQEVAGTSQTSYFSEDAKVMYFYTDYCHWCQKEKEVLEQLGKEGYKVKPMNIGEKPDVWKQYNISGTPTFVAANGERLVGFNEKEPLKTWLDQHK